MGENILYSDKLIEIKENEILFRNYYLPSFLNKTVKYVDIEKIEVEEPTIKIGRFRYWGTGDFLHWFPHDSQRNKREVIYILFKKNKRSRIGFTVENSEKVTEILKQKVTVHLKNVIMKYTKSLKSA